MNTQLNQILATDVESLTKFNISELITARNILKGEQLDLIQQLDNGIDVQNELSVIKKSLKHINSGINLIQQVKSNAKKESSKKGANAPSFKKQVFDILREQYPEVFTEIEQQIKSRTHTSLGTNT